MLGLRHREATANLPANERQKVVLLLLGRGMGYQDFGVTNIRGLAIE